MAWSIDRTAVKVFVSLMLVVNGALFAFLFAAAAAIRGIGAVVAQSISLVILPAMLLSLGGHTGAGQAGPGYDLATIALNVAAIVSLVFFLVATILLWTRSRFYRTGALIAAIIIALGYGWFVVFDAGTFAAELFPGWAQLLARAGVSAALAVLAGAVLLAVLRGSPKSSPAQP